MSLRLKSPLSPSVRSPSAYSGFHLPSSSSDESDGDEPLPFPTALSRKDFLAADFNATNYLSSLFPSDADTTSAHRHQTLEDLRSELRERSAAISAELLELVNSNYTSFLSLGDELKGGEDRVEDVRVSLLGFQRAVDDIKGRVRSRRLEVSDVCQELDEVRGSIELGRQIVELDGRVGLLEGRLALSSLPKGSNNDVLNGIGLDDSEEEDGDDTISDGEGNFANSSPEKLLGLARDLVAMQSLADTIGRDVAFVKKLDDRISRCRNTLLLDLNASTREAWKAGLRGQSRLLKLLAIYRLLDAQAEATKVVKGK